MVELVFPRVVYRGEADTLGLGTVGETQVCATADGWVEAKTAGWRLMRDGPDPAPIAEPITEPPVAEPAKKSAKK